MTTNPQKHVGCSLNRVQYLEFLKFCKKTDQSKFRVVQLAVLKYCKITVKGGNTLRGDIDKEIEEMIE